MANIKKILIVDDHSIVSRGLNYLITLNFKDCSITVASSLQEMALRLSTVDYTHLILDLNLDDGSSIDILPQLIEKYPDLYILIYSMVSKEVFAKKLMQFNISGFLSKKALEAEIIQAMQIFLNGGIYISKNIKNSIAASSTAVIDTNMFHNLSITELKVLGMILKGNRAKEIANELHVSPQTINTYKSGIFKKLCTENIFEIQKLTEIYSINFS